MLCGILRLFGFMKVTKKCNITISLDTERRDRSYSGGTGFDSRP